MERDNLGVIRIDGKMLVNFISVNLAKREINNRYIPKFYINISP